MDGTKVAVIGLDEILAEICSEGRLANRETADEIMKRLEDRRNYIPSSEITRREYRHILLEEYREHLSSRAGEGSK